MNELTTLYPAHVAQLQQRVKAALLREDLEGLVIHSGQEIKVFLDDYTYPFKINFRNNIALVLCHFFWTK